MSLHLVNVQSDTYLRPATCAVTWAVRKSANFGENSSLAPKARNALSSNPFTIGSFQVANNTTESVHDCLLVVVLMLVLCCDVETCQRW